jgi:hypothetical protein
VISVIYIPDHFTSITLYLSNIYEMSPDVEKCVDIGLDTEAWSGVKVVSLLIVWYGLSLPMN